MLDTTVVLVHGAFHGAWCWDRVTRGLAKLGIGAYAVDLPRYARSAEAPVGLAADAEALRSVLRQCPGRVVVCAHSYGGAVVTEAYEERGQSDQLVYLAAIVPDVEEGLSDCIPDFSATPLFSAMTAGESGNLQVEPEKAGDIFYHDCDPDVARWAISQLGPQSAASLASRATRAAWREVESTFILCENDRVLSAAVQERMAKRCTRVVRWPTGHSAMLSRPELLVDLLASLADRTPGTC